MKVQPKILCQMPFLSQSLPIYLDLRLAQNMVECTIQGLVIMESIAEFNDLQCPDTVWTV